MVTLEVCICFGPNCVPPFAQSTLVAPSADASDYTLLAAGPHGHIVTKYSLAQKVGLQCQETMSLVHHTTANVGVGGGGRTRGRRHMKRMLLRL